MWKKIVAVIILLVLAILFWYVIPVVAALIIVVGFILMIGLTRSLTDENKIPIRPKVNLT